MDSRHVLLIDDDPVVLKVLTIVLDLEEFRVSTATDGGSGLALFAAERPDVVVCDVVMGELDGHEVCRRIKSDPGAADVPVVLLSAYDGHEARVAGEAAGCDAYMAKPFRPLELLEVIRDVRAASRDVEEG